MRAWACVGTLFFSQGIESKFWQVHPCAVWWHGNARAPATNDSGVVPQEDFKVLLKGHCWSPPLLRNNTKPTVVHRAFKVLALGKNIACVSVCRYMNLYPSFFLT